MSNKTQHLDKGSRWIKVNTVENSTTDIGDIVKIIRLHGKFSIDFEILESRKNIKHQKITMDTDNFLDCFIPLCNVILDKNCEKSTQGKFETPKLPTPACDTFIESEGVIVSDTVSDGRIGDEFKHEIAQLNAENDFLKRDLKEAEQDIDSLKDDERINLRLLNLAHKEKHKLQSLEWELRTKNSKLSSDNLVLNNKLSKSQDKNRTLKRDIETLLSERSQLFSQLDNMSGEVTALKEQLNTPKETIIRKIFK